MARTPIEARGPNQRASVRVLSAAAFAISLRARGFFVNQTHLDETVKPTGMSRMHTRPCEPRRRLTPLNSNVEIVLGKSVET
jgi:hypothetical protein